MKKQQKAGSTQPVAPVPPVALVAPVGLSMMQGLQGTLVGTLSKQIVKSAPANLTVNERGQLINSDGSILPVLATIKLNNKG